LTQTQIARNPITGARRIKIKKKKKVLGEKYRDKLQKTKGDRK